MKNIEILAPAGSKEAFIAAVEAGADAIYCGLKNFSARSKAQNFTAAEFNNYVNYAHGKNVKVYATFNTLIKQNEIKDAVKQITSIAQANADAIIIQDLGIANIVKNYFPQLKLHASTQLSIHNSYGVSEAEKAGFKRIVLARELSLQEIKNIKAKTKAELEIFCHGALCFGVSGLCLISSFIGGLSGNRGMCAQPCRRRWRVSDTKTAKDGFFISPKDLDLSAHIKEIENSGITSLKIEGRMKNPQYVYKTVKAYKMLVNSTDETTIKEAKKLLSSDYARSKTTFNFIQKSKDIFTPDMPKQMGEFLSEIISIKDNIITLKTQTRLNKTDILKAADSKADIYFKINILDINKTSEACEIETDTAGLKTGMQVFKTADGNFEEFLQNIVKNTEIEKKEFKVTGKSIAFPRFKKTESQGNLFIKINDLNWLPFIKGSPSLCHPELVGGTRHPELVSGSRSFNGAMLKQVQHDTSIIFTLDKENIKHVQKASEIKYFELPPYIDEQDLAVFEETINKLKSKEFFLNNLEHFKFFKKEASLHAGNFLYVLNSFSADFLLKNKIVDFVPSIEDDFKNISELAGNGLAGRAIFYLSGFPALAASAMTQHCELSKNKNIESLKDTFQVIHRNNKVTIIPQYPVMLFNKKKRLEKLGINKFIIDLSFIVPNKTYLETVLNAYYGKIPLQNGCEFNFERGLK
ncbi:MAG: U32 family peptidase [Endomicrobia bacterium]|nr:U32 family peptidase [Endomicrobiia bacterium]MCL2798989.1 U32 family peptidase [Endomicrobiia bacterium]